MGKIYKYELDSFNQLVEVPSGAKLLKIMMQNGKPHAWFEVDTTQPLVKRVIEWIVTGGRSPRYGTYIDTLCVDGYHIIHFYDCGVVS